MVLWNLLDGGPSHSGPLHGPSESMRGGTPGTNPHHNSKGVTFVALCLEMRCAHNTFDKTATSWDSPLSSS